MELLVYIGQIEIFNMPKQLDRGKSFNSQVGDLLLLLLYHMSGEKKALRCVEPNSVEMAMEWLFNHLKELVQEEDELSQSLSLSLVNFEVPKDDANEKGRDVSFEEKPL